jgi:transcriptional regulator with XRE-family HTH domain
MGVSRLAERLRELRSTGRPRPLTQHALGAALGVSVPLISSWEHGKVPPVDRLEAYARLFAVAPTVADDDLRAARTGQLSDTERARFAALRRELLMLRNQTAVGPPNSPEVPSPLQFPAGEAITIVCSELPDRLRSQLGYSSDQDPDYVASYKYADLDALIELLPFITALNPTSAVAVGISGELTTDDLTAHLIALGGVDFNAVTEAVLVDLAHVPVRQLTRPRDEDTGGFSVRTAEGQREFKPRLRRDGDRTTLSEDVAHFLRAPNPYNHARTLTFFNGTYSRGSYGVVRALTAPKIRERNAAYVADRYRDVDTYSIVSRVKIVANEVVVPDWTLSDIRLHEWPEAGIGHIDAAPPDQPPFVASPVTGA